MSYYTISNFRAGLDTRRDILASLAGTLVTLNNCHLNQGGEIEKRKAFVFTALPANTFGLETTDVGKITFGSVADPGGWPIGGVVAYQRLQHPAVLAGAAYNAAYHAMTEVVASQNFQGKALVLAKFADGRNFLYYNGTVVLQSYSGIVLPGFATNAAINDYIRDTLVTGFNAQNGWLAFDFTSLILVPVTANNAQFVARSPTTITFASSKSNSTSVGILAWTFGYPVAPTAGTASAASFTLAGAPGSTYKVYGPIDIGGTILFTLMGLITRAWAVSDAATATAIAGDINAQTANTGYSASALGAVVTVNAPIPSGLYATVYNQGNLIVTAVADGTANGPHAFANGAYAVTGSGQETGYLVDDTWAVGDTYQLTVNPSTGATFVLGRGNLNDLTSATASNIFVDRQRAYAANGKRFNFSAISDPTGWENYNTGAGFLPFTSQYGVEDSCIAFSTYLGFTAVFGRRSIQIWTMPASPDSFDLVQVLNNIGTVAKLSPQSLGTAETIFLADTGYRSLRQKAIEANAFVEDIGSPIDITVQTALAAASDATKAAACSIVEPTQGRYWGFLDGVIYVLSYFPSNKIVGWSTYAPTYNVAGVQTAFTPQKFIVASNQVFARSATGIIAFGGSGGNTYDACQATVQTPFQSGGGGVDKPATWKVAKGIDVVMQGAWILSAGMDWVSGTLETVYTAGQSSYDGGTIPFESRGTHFSLKATSVAASAARIASLVFHFQEAEETA